MNNKTIKCKCDINREVKVPVDTSTDSEGSVTGTISVHV